MRDRNLTGKWAEFLQSSCVTEVGEPVACLASSKADFIRGFDIDAAPSLQKRVRVHNADCRRVRMASRAACWSSGKCFVLSAILWAVVDHGAIRVRQVSTWWAIAEPAVIQLAVIVASLGLR